MRYVISITNSTWPDELNTAIIESNAGDVIVIDSETPIEGQYPADLAVTALRKLQKAVTVERILSPTASMS